jgi:predicted ester cyclase
MGDLQAAKAAVRRLYEECDHAPDAELARVMDQAVSADYAWRGVHPFDEIAGAPAVVDRFWLPLRYSLGHLQRREDIFMAGRSHPDGHTWVMSMGHLLGLFDRPWLGIPPTGRVAFLRYAEFHRVADGRIAETALFCDIIGLMKQAGLEPLPPQSGEEIIVPGPRTHDGLLSGVQDEAETRKSFELANSLKDRLTTSYGTQPSAELLATLWHEDMLWYGPSGIGSTYTIARYREQHQIPFRDGLRDLVFNGHVCNFAEGNYAAWFGWPNLTGTPAGGFLGLPGSDVRADMRVVDVYRREGERLAENWVFIDLLHWLKQQGVDVLARTAELSRLPAS